MSSVDVHLKLVCPDGASAQALKTQLARLDLAAPAAPPALTRVFAEPSEWTRVHIDGVRVKADVVSFDYQDAAQDAWLSPAQRQAWLDLGVAFVHLHVEDSQIGEAATAHYHGLMEISAKEFKARAVSTEVPEPKKVVRMAQQGRDDAIAQALQKGVDVNALVDGMPLFVHLIASHYPSPAAMAALARREIDWRLGLPWAPKFIGGFADFPPRRIVDLLKALFTAAGPQLPQLVRHEAVWTVLLAVPAILEWVCQQAGVDVNAPVLHGVPGREVFGRIENGSSIADEYGPCGSILHHLTGEGHSDALAYTVKMFIYRQQSRLAADPFEAGVAILQRHGAQAVAPQGRSMAQRFVAYLRDAEGAEPLDHLMHDGLALTQPFHDGTLPLVLATRCVAGWAAPLAKFHALLAAGADAGPWSSWAGFQEDLLVRLFDAEHRRHAARQTGEKFRADRHADTVAGILDQMARRGLSLKKPLKLNLTGADHGLQFQGSLLGAVALLLCGRNSELRPWCLPLVKVLQAHGARGSDLAETIPLEKAFTGTASLRLTGPWSQVLGPDERTTRATVLERLQQRQALQGADDIDEAVIQLLQAGGG